jgi:aspartate/methionine/tyrosine aminotransferase
MFFAILALVDEGDEVLLPNPAFPIYESMVDFAGGRPVFVPLRQENGFRFDLGEFLPGLGERTKLVILNSPANPTGGVLTAEDIAGLAEILRERPDVYVLATRSTRGCSTRSVSRASPRSRARSRRRGPSSSTGSPRPTP